MILLRAPTQTVDQDLGSTGWVGENFLILKQQPIDFLETASNEY